MRELSDGCIIQVVCQGDAVTFDHLEDFVFAVSVEGGPLDGLLAVMAPRKVDCFTTMLDAQCTAFMLPRQAYNE